jgi:hypothetical protein
MRLGLALGRQAVDADRVGLRPGARGVDHRAGALLVHAVGGLHLQQEVGLFAPRGARLVEAEPRHRDHARAEADVRRQRRRARQRQQVVVDQFAGRRQALVVGCAPARGGQQAARGAVDVVAPGRKQTHLPDAAEVPGDAGAGLEHDHRQAALHQMGGGREADRTGADDGHRRRGSRG